MGKNKKNQIRVSFVGNNSEHVTGSCTLIETQTKKILVECGLVQGEATLLADYKLNTQKFDFKPKEIDYIFIGHIHADHCCLLPRLYAQGCKAKIIAPSGTYDLARILLEDSAYIMSRDVETLKRKTGKEYSPIYTSEDVETCLEYWNEFNFEYPINLDSEVKFNFIGSGHIINATQIELWIKSGNNTKKILFTSDLGSSIPKFYSTKFKPVDKANLVVGECTYADGSRCATIKDRKIDLEKIKSVIDDICLDKKGKVLIPTFALDRTQNILTFLYNMYKNDENCPIVIVDSPMACKITKLFSNLLNGDDAELYKKVLNWNKLRLVEEYETSKVYQFANEPMIVLSCSGMLAKGRSVNWCAKLLPNSNNCILFVGYSAYNSLGRKIKEGKQKTITIDGKPIKNRCCIVDLKSFSSHMQHDDLLKYYSDINADKIALVHGEFSDKLVFCKELQDERNKKCKSGKVICANKSTEIVL